MGLYELCPMQDFVTSTHSRASSLVKSRRILDTPARIISPRLSAIPPSSGYSVKCPLPGTVLSVKVAVGDTITKGQTLVILEAMKMENNIDADRAGVVKQVLVQQGATVMEGDNLIVIE